MLPKSQKAILPMFQVYILTAIATSFLFFLLFSPTPKQSYHSLYISTSLSDNASIAHHLYTLTKRPHIAGSEANADAASYVLSTLSSYAIPSRIVSYDVALTYPISRSLALIRPPPEPPTTFHLQQELYDGDPYADVAGEEVPTFHAYAKSGTVTGPVVYVNYGRVEDYEMLKEMGVSVEGCVVLARYGKIYRGDIVQNAYEAGAVGAVVYSDRKDYGGARWFPDEKWLPPSGVQVGSLLTTNGDPTTPGWASTMEDCERLSEEDVRKGMGVGMIPSLPISGADGEAIIRTMGGQVANDDWQGSTDAPVYRVGPGPAILNLSYTGEQKITTIQNVIGVIEGAEEPDRYVENLSKQLGMQVLVRTVGLRTGHKSSSIWKRFVLLGNHRDAWTFGAVDPNSGTASLLEIAQRLRKLQKKGWRPRRTIILCNWDAEEYGLIGSTEWVEENRELLASRAVAYLNVDCAVSGAGFHASATPQLDELLKRAAKQVQDPDNSSQSIYESWVGSRDSPMIGRLGGGGSDFAAFVQYVGVPAIDIFFGGGYPVYHSMYDDYIWMKKFGDPMFHRHAAVASIWGLVALQLADEEFLPFDYLSYAFELQKSAKELEEEISDKGITLIPLFNSIEKLKGAATKINHQKKEIEENSGWASIWEKEYLKVRELNDRLMMAERAFTDRNGLLGRPWYKHLIYAPSKHDDYGSKSFPGIDDAIENAKRQHTEKSWSLVQHEVWRVSRAIRHASLVLDGELT